eukprot:m.32919 g.32919  ORF g.32919 m.32919 type:complete len:178 (+) comp5589_c0_seq1:160-693(+)
MARATAMALATAAALVTWLIAPSRIAANVALSLGGFFLALKVIPGMRQLFISAHLSGFDLNKSESDKIPEALGVVAGAIYLVVMFAYIPFRFWGKQDPETEAFPHEQFVEFICALLSICCMIFLGFADDVLNLKWRSVAPACCAFACALVRLSAHLPPPLHPNCAFPLRAQRKKKST